MVAVVLVIVILLERFVSSDISLFVLLNDEGLLKPSDECFKCALGFSTTNTFDAVADVLICSKANCGNGKRIDSTWSLNNDG